jgi:hypothetical protein
MVDDWNAGWCYKLEATRFLMCRINSSDGEGALLVEGFAGEKRRNVPEVSAEVVP